MKSAKLEANETYYYRDLTMRPLISERSVKIARSITPENNEKYSRRPWKKSPQRNLLKNFNSNDIVKNALMSKVQKSIAVEKL